MKNFLILISLVLSLICWKLLNDKIHLKEEKIRYKNNYHSANAQNEANKKKVEILNSREIEETKKTIIQGKELKKIPARKIENITKMKVINHDKIKISGQNKQEGPEANINLTENYIYHDECRNVEIIKDLKSSNYTLNISDTIPIETIIYWQRNKKLLFGLIKYGSKSYEIQADTPCKSTYIIFDRVIVRKKK
jgi:hypothetical protein